MEEEKEGISFGEILKRIWSQKWIALIVAAVITVAGTLGLYFGYTKNTQEYVRQFTITFPGSGSGTYPDGTPYVYSALITPEKLEEIKAENSTLSYLDVSKMYEKSDIYIDRQIIKIDEQSNEGDIVFAIHVKTKRMKSVDDARALIDAIAQAPVNYVKNLANDQDIYIANYGKTVYLEDKLDLLESQRSYLHGQISNINAQTMATSERTRIINELDEVSRTLAAMRGDMNNNHYAHNVDELKITYANMVKNMQRERDIKLQALKYSYGNFSQGGAGVGSDNIQPTETMVRLSEEISNLEADIKLYEEYIASAQPAPQTFTDALQAAYDKLVALTAECEKEIAAYYDLTSLVAYNGEVVTSGGMSVIICLLIGLLAGIIIGCIAAYVVAVKKPKEVPQSEPQPDVVAEN